MIAVADTPAMPPDDEADETDTGPKRRSMNPLLKKIDKVFAAMDDLTPSAQQIALTLINETYSMIDTSVLDPRD